MSKVTKVPAFGQFLLDDTLVLRGGLLIKIVQMPTFDYFGHVSVGLYAARKNDFPPPMDFVMDLVKNTYFKAACQASANDLPTFIAIRRIFTI